MADALGFQQCLVEGREVQPLTAILLGAEVAGGSHQIRLGGITQLLDFGDKSRKVRVSVPLSETFAGLSITIRVQIGVSLAQQLLRACKRADLNTAIAKAPRNRLRQPSPRL